MDFSDKELERYSRQIILREVGGLGQIKLKGSSVLIIGSGGLGVPAATQLVGAGVGTVTIVDADTVDISNLPRQTLYRTSDIGAPKADVAAKHLSALNPDVCITAVPERATADTLPGLLSGQDLVLDGSDNFETRLAVNDAAVAAGVPLISGAVAGFDGQVATFAPTKGEGLPCYRCLMPEHPGEAADQTCSDMGILGPVTAHIGSMMAFEALRELMGLEGGLRGKLHLVNLLTGVQRTIRLPKDPHCPVCRDGDQDKG